MERRTHTNNQIRTDQADLIRPGDLRDPYPDTLSAFERSTAEKAYSENGVQVEIPRLYLAGRQEPWEYTRSPEYRVKSLYHQFGRELLVRKPIWTVLTPTPIGEQSLIIVDGHKRTRYSSLFGINPLPSSVIGIEHLAQAWEVDLETLSAKLNRQSTNSFSRFEEIAHNRNKRLARPLNVPGNLKISDLPDYFESLKPRSNTPIQMQPARAYVLHGRR